MACHAGALSRISRGKNAVRHVDASFHGLKEEIRRSHTHKVAWLIFRHKVRGVVQYVAHGIQGLADGKPAYGIAGKIHGHQLLGTSSSKVLVHASLDDAEEVLPLLVVVVNLAALGPATGALGRMHNIVS